MLKNSVNERSINKKSQNLLYINYWYDYVYESVYPLYEWYECCKPSPCYLRIKFPSWNV